MQEPCFPDPSPVDGQSGAVGTRRALAGVRAAALTLAPTVLVLLMASSGIIGLEEAYLAYGPWPVLAVLGQSLPLLLLRRAPGTALVVVAGVTAAHLAAGLPVTNGMMGQAVATCAVVGRTRWPVSPLVPGTVLAISSVSAWAGHQPGLGRLLSFTALSLLVAWVVGDAAERRTQVRRAMEGELARRRNRVRLRVQAVALEERLRITRELHDLVGEALDAVVVQATAARAQLGRPEVDRPLAAIEKTGRGALAELDRFLGYLRQPTVRGPDTSAPVPVPVAVAEGRRLPWPLRQRFLSGVGPVLGVGFLAFVDALSTPAESWPVPLWPVVLAALVALPLLRRARNSEAVLGFLLALLAGLALLGLAVDGGLLALAVALHAVAVRGSRGRALGAAALTCALAVTVTAAIIDLREATQLAGPLLGLAAIALYVGDTARVAREHNATLTQRIAEAAGEERLRERVAVMEERTRMARDLHDSIGHTFSLVVLQAGAARLATTSPETPSAERIAVALRSIEASARGALEELDAVVQSMDRDASGDPPFVPAPEDLHAVVDSVRTAGTGVSVAADPTGDLPRPVQVTILRIVQEALTNVVKHAPGATATVEVKRADDSVRVTVHNDAGSRPDQALPSGGRGLIGMQERVSLLGGDFLAGRDIDGGHRVDARIPLPRSPSSSPSLTRTGDSR